MFLVGQPNATQTAKEAKQDRWEPAIQKFEKADRAEPPPKGANLFVGSSSIVRWPLDESFPGYKVINRGFGGSQVSDSLRYADRVILPYEPSVVVIYAGDNDVAAGVTPEKIAENVETLVEKVHAALPKTTIVFVAIKPSIKRWNLVDKVSAANKLVMRQANGKDYFEYLDIFKPMLDKEGHPRPELFAKDGLHLSPTGYDLWDELVEPYLTKSPAVASDAN
ncbi:GDSL-like Lipase/Acylhydrolase [Planctomycetes bacterium Pan216]|uniref:GDSL-like Lipase/Acylhydrolase n=1 Tax=Kolteria novifilia TaxID=2527975 RepID=A0A518B7W0_9BACT|nr:GDSL-like Lipase/Acylhydrolase [Planctomycetes bacterium Pan216]